MSDSKAVPPEVLEDRVLMTRYLRGDFSAFEELYRRHSPKVYGYLKKRVRNLEDVDEIFQKIFAKFHSSRETYKESYPVLQWLFVISRSVMLDHLKSLRRKADLSEKVLLASLSQSAPEVSLSEQMTSEISFQNPELTSAAPLKSLAPLAKEVVHLRVIDELSFAEIATRLGLRESNVRQVLSRSLRKLKLSLGGGGS